MDYSLRGLPRENISYMSIPESGTWQVLRCSLLSVSCSCCYFFISNVFVFRQKNQEPIQALSITLLYALCIILLFYIKQD